MTQQLESYIAELKALQDKYAILHADRDLGNSLSDEISDAEGELQKMVDVYEAEAVYIPEYETTFNHAQQGTIR